MQRDLKQTLLCFDFDGTIFGHEYIPPVSREFYQYLYKMVAAGAKWGINTGRSYEHLLEGLSLCAFSEPPQFLVTKEREIYYYDATKNEYDLDLQWKEGCERSHKKLFREKADFIIIVERFVKEQTQAEWISEPGDPAGIVATSIEEMDRIVGFVESLLCPDRDVEYLRSTIYLRFTHPDYHKGTSLKWVASHFNISNENVFAVGDGQNDLGMLNPAYSSMLACPSNAVDLVKEEVRSHGGIVAEKEVSFGVADAMQTYFSNL